MLIVPLEKDIIQTMDGESYRVVSYTNYKDSGPAIYVRDKESKKPILVYFFDIDSINGTKVEYQRGSKIFRALGKISRKFHLPQPDDKVIVLSNKVDDKDDKEKAEVVALKLKSKALGVSKGLFVKTDEDEYFRLTQILDIDRAGTSNEPFDREAFLDYYKEYTGA